MRWPFLSEAESRALLRPARPSLAGFTLRAFLVFLALGALLQRACS